MRRLPSPPQAVLGLLSGTATNCQPARFAEGMANWWVSPLRSVTRRRKWNGVPSVFTQKPTPSPGWGKSSFLLIWTYSRSFLPVNS